jgi:hypothetical protein
MQQPDHDEKPPMGAFALEVLARAKALLAQPTSEGDEALIAQAQAADAQARAACATPE